MTPAERKLLITMARAIYAQTLNHRLLCDIREAIADVEREASGAEQEQK